jgi:DNA mismatch repair protein MutS
MTVSVLLGLTRAPGNEVRAISFFSTHYHQLIRVVEALPGARNFSVETKIQNGEVKFLYQLIEGGTEESYGIYVAKLAGLPSEVLDRSLYLLSHLEENHTMGPI